MIAHKFKVCSDCGESKPISHFHRRRTSLDGRMSYCGDCNNKRSSAWQKKEENHDHLTYWRYEWRSKSPRQSLCVSLNGALKRRPTENPATLDDLMELWERQEGKCALSAIPMTWAQGKVTPTSITLDRIDHKGGYSKDNLRLLCYAVNTFRGNGSDEDMLAIAKALVAEMERKMEYLF